MFPAAATATAAAAVWGAGAVASLPIEDAVRCIYTWEVNKGDGVFLLSPFDQPDRAPGPPAAAAAAAAAGEGASMWGSAKLQQRISGLGLSELLLLGEGKEKKAELNLSVNCYRRDTPLVFIQAPPVSLHIYICICIYIIYL